MSKLVDWSWISKEHIPDGSVIAIGGVHSHNVPMGLVRQLIRIGSKDLTLVGSISAGLPIDLLVAAGCVKKVLAPYVGFEMWGLAQNYRRAVQSGAIEAPDVCEAFPIYSLSAAANGMLFYPFPEHIHKNSGVPGQSDLYRKVRDPFTGKEVYALQALQPDVALIHVQQASEDGNCIHWGSVVTDRVMAEAARLTIVSCDELIPVEEVRKHPERTTIPSIFVDHVIHQEGTAFPTSSHGKYKYSEEHILNYLKMDQEGLQRYLEDLMRPEPEYLSDKVYVQEFSGTPVEGDYTLKELIACVFSRDIRDGELGICGAVSEIPMAAMHLAERRQAPNLRWIAGGSGYVSPRGTLVPSSTDFEMATGADARLSMVEVMAVEMTKIDFFFAGGLQIDAKGNTNLGGILVDGKWKLRGPGSVGLPFLPRAGRTYLYTLTHNARTLVEEVSYISGPGHHDPSDATGQGPKLLVTNLCVFEWGGDRWSLRSLHPGVSLEQVKESTGFEFSVPDEVPVTEVPTEEELRILREFDRFGVLR